MLLKVWQVVWLVFYENTKKKRKYSQELYVSIYTDFLYQIM